MITTYNWPSWTGWCNMIDGYLTWNRNIVQIKLYLRSILQSLIKIWHFYYRNLFYYFWYFTKHYKRSIKILNNLLFDQFKLDQAYLIELNLIDSISIIYEYRSVILCDKRFIFLSKKVNTSLEIRHSLRSRSKRPYCGLSPDPIAIVLLDMPAEF